MGGKNKSSQRTKNNVRPSSSGRSVQFLSGAGGSDANPFGGSATSGQKPATMIFSSLAAVTSEQTLNTEFTLCIKKLNKKDPVTKTKALQELSELVLKSDVEDVKQVLPVWSRTYPTLAFDAEHKVREAAHVCLRSILQVVSRASAPYLKALLPPCLSGVNDLSPDVSAAASETLTTIFPGDKLRQVIMFCKNELMLYFTKYTIGEDADPQCVWCVCSVRGFRVVCEYLKGGSNEKDELKGLEHHFNALLVSDKWWKLPTNKDNQELRDAWFSTMAMVLVCCQSICDPYYKKLLNMTLAHAKGPNYHSQVWECLLVLMKILKDADVWNNKKKELINNIYELFENGYGASILLPLFAHLPQNMIDKEVYETYFSKCCEGLLKNHVINSKPDRNTWINGIKECIQYLAKQDIDYSTEVVSFAIRKLIETVLTYGRKEIVNQTSVNLADLIIHWMQKNDSVKYDLLVRLVWQNIKSIISTQLDNLTVEKMPCNVEKHSVFLQAMQKSQYETPVRKKSLRFSDQNDPCEQIDKIEPKCLMEPILQDRYNHNLNEIIHYACAKYLKFTQSNNFDTGLVNSLEMILNMFDTKTVFDNICIETNNESVLALYNNVFRDHMQTDSSGKVTEIVLMIVKYLSEKDQIDVFDSISQVPSACIHRVLGMHSKPARTWLKNIIPNINDKKQIKTLMEHMEEYDEVIRSQVLCLCLNNLRTSSGDYDEQLFEVIYSVPVELWFHSNTLTAIFNMLLVPTWNGNDELANSFREWSLQVLSQAPRVSRQDFLTLIKKRIDTIYERTDNLKLNEIEHLSSLSLNFINENPSEELNTNDLISFIEKIFDNNNKVFCPVEYFALRLDCVRCNFVCLFDDTQYTKRLIEDCDKRIDSDIEKADFIAYANRNMFRCRLFKDIVVYGDGICKEAIGNQMFLSEVVKCFYDYAIVHTLFEGYDYWTQHGTIKTCRNTLENDMLQIIGKCQRYLDIIGSELTRRAAERGYYWAYAYRYFVDLCKKVFSDSDEVNKMTRSHLATCLPSLTGNGYFHSLQAICRSKEQIDNPMWFVTEVTKRVCVNVDVGQEQNLMDAIIQQHYTQTNNMCDDLDTCSWIDVSRCASVLWYLQESVYHNGFELANEHFDFVTTNLATVIHNLAKCADKFNTTEWSMIGGIAFKLFNTMNLFISKIKSEAERREIQSYLINIPDEWNDVFLPNIYKNIEKIVSVVAKDSNTLPEAWSVWCVIWRDLVVICKSSGDKVWQHNEQMSSIIMELLKPNSHISYKLLAHVLLQKIKSVCVQQDEKIVEEWGKIQSEITVDDESECERPHLSLSLLEHLLMELSEIVLVILQEVSIGEGTCVLESTSESASITLSYLILALGLIERSPFTDDLYQHYKHYYMKMDIVSQMFDISLRLLPSLDVKELSSQINNFINPTPEVLDVTDLSSLVQQLSCRLLYACLSDWSSAGSDSVGINSKFLGGLNENLLSEHISRADLLELKKRIMQMEVDDNIEIEVVVQLSTREASVRVVVEEESGPSLAMRLSRSHPLASPSCEASSCVSSVRRAKGLRLYALASEWLNSAQGRAKSSPRCFICYNRLHATTGRPPKQHCHTCNNKFHSQCLHKWFSTSNKSSCPLCRANF